ncbi:MAG TPA: hypothetical protein VNV36_03195, partial [Pseudomonas sp.]|uniref:hypothetical protein n=1 Tax=Pseudomonas sp. TaxID=306 RepID=UPI002D1B7E0E
IPQRRNPSLRGPNAGASLFGYFFGVWKKCLAVRAKPPAAATEATDIHTRQTQGMAGPDAAKTTQARK